MIQELWTYLRTPCPRPYRKLGYLKGLVAIEARHQRHEAAWAPHLAQCHRAMIDSVSLASARNKVVILGSGLLLDVPLAPLCHVMREVVLVDLAHLPSVRRRVKGKSKVTLVEHDVTGLAEALLALKSGDELPPPAATLPPEAEGADLIISTNMLSQLDITPRLEASQRTGRPESELDLWCRAILADHLRLLRGSGAFISLLTDSVHRYLDGEGREVERDDVIPGVELPDPVRSWTWTIAPLGELQEALELQADVGWYPLGPGGEASPD